MQIGGGLGPSAPRAYSKHDHLRNQDY